MAPKHDSDHEYHNPSDPLSTTSVRCKLVTRKDESIPSITMQDEYHTDSMDELVTMVNDTIDEDNKQPPNQLRSSMSESTLHRISKMAMKEVVEDKKMELTRSGMKILENNVDVLSLIDTSEVYGLINDSINKYNQRNTVQRFINDMVGNTNIPAVVHNSNETTYMEQDEINDLNKDLRHLRYGLRDNINDDDHGNNHDNSNLVDDGLNFNNIIGAHIVEEKEECSYEWTDTYDQWNDYYHIPTEENGPESSHTFMGDNNIFEPTKIKHNGKSKTRLVSEVSTSVKSDFTSANVKNKHRTFEANN